MINTKFGDALRSKTDAAMKNEALCDILCHNVCCLTQSMFELGGSGVLGREVAEPATVTAEPITSDCVDAWNWV
jgi:hypothetical protein